MNGWLRAGAPIDPSSFAPVAIGTSGALLAGAAAHPLYAVFELADQVESARDSGLWKVLGLSGTGDITNGSFTVNNAPTTFANGQAVIGTGVPVGSYIVSGGGTTTLTLSQAAAASP